MLASRWSTYFSMSFAGMSLAGVVILNLSACPVAAQPPAEEKGAYQQRSTPYPAIDLRLKAIERIVAEREREFRAARERSQKAPPRRFDSQRDQAITDAFRTAEERRQADGKPHPRVVNALRDQQQQIDELAKRLSHLEKLVKRQHPDIHVDREQRHEPMRDATQRQATLESEKRHQLSQARQRVLEARSQHIDQLMKRLTAQHKEMQSAVKNLEREMAMARSKTQILTRDMQLLDKKLASLKQEAQQVSKDKKLIEQAVQELKQHRDGPGKRP